MVANEGSNNGGDGDPEEQPEDELPEDLGDLSEEELEEMVEMMGDQMTEEESEALDSVMWLLCQVEAAGSIEKVRELGVLDAAPEDALAMVRAMVPPSRGGDAQGERAEMEWNRFVDSMIAENGEDFFDRVRAEMEGRP